MNIYGDGNENERKSPIIVNTNNESTVLEIRMQLRKGVAVELEIIPPVKSFVCNDKKVLATAAYEAVTDESIKKGDQVEDCSSL